MATNGEMFAFVANFGPMLGELAARVGHLEARIEAMEGSPVVGGDPIPATDPGGEVEFMGQKFDMKAMFEAGMPPGGIPGMMERMKNWKPPAAAPVASAPAAPAPATPPTPTT